MATVTLKCQNCGGDLRFDPQSQKYKCEYCLSMFSQQQLDQMLEKEKAKEAEDKTKQEAVPEAALAVVFSCGSCGAEIVTDETTAATFCYYCHNPVVLSGRLKGEYQPDIVVPFTIDREHAAEIFRQWIGKKKYVPKAFYSDDQVEKITGVYFPYWTYSCLVKGQIEAEGRTVRTRTVGNIRSTETKKYQVERQGEMNISNVPRNALKKANRKLVEGVLPYDMNEMKTFSMGYLSGFQAENRDMNQQEFTQEVEQEVQSFAFSVLKQEIGGYDSVSVRSQKAQLTNENWRYALMPVWTLTYRSSQDGTVYYFACNGQSGKICGELPVDKGRLAILFASIFVPLMAVLLFVGWLI